MTWKLGRACFYVLAFASVASMCQSASAQWRTKYFRRDGLFHVEKYHTGNGLTPVGGEVLMAGITAFAPIVGTLAGRDAPRDEAQREAPRDMPRALLPEEYIVEQRRANDLLERTANLVNWLPPAGGAPGPQPLQNGPSPGPVPSEFGARSPWAPRPNNGASAGPGGGGAANPPGNGAGSGDKNPWKSRPE
jgi:hypothetical protein